MSTDISPNNPPQPQPRKRGRPKLPPGVKGAYKGRPQAPIQPQATEETIKEGGLPSNREYPEVLLPATQSTPTAQASQEHTKDEGEKVDWSIVLADRGKRLEETINAILPKAESRVRGAVGTLIQRTSEGKFWSKAIDGLPLTWAEFHGYLNRPLLKELWLAAQECGKTWRDNKAEEAMFVRGVEGFEETTYDKGEDGPVIRSTRKFSDRCLELYARANMAGKYNLRPEGESANVAAVQVIVYHQDQPQSATKAIPVDVSEAKSTQPAG